MFELKASDLINLQRFYKRAPEKFIRAMAGTMNSIAFGNRTESLKIIEKRMTVRNKRFVNSRIRVAKARTSNLTSEVGSIAAPRFSGWAEQELGVAAKRTRVMGLMARRGNYTNQAMHSARLKPGSTQITDDQYAGKTRRFRTRAMLMDLKRRKIKRPFVIKRHRKFAPGLYKMVRGHVVRLQRFKATRTPRRIRWLSDGRKNYFASNDIRKTWAKAIDYVLRKKQ
ncbi:MAG: hypothetical protein GY874_18425 [Desulfobacteraceae bacterium]|nr:hypothetical protein [Desulfobacteraceae bacterium]